MTMAPDQASETAPAVAVLPVEVKPSWRGWIHAGTFPAAIALGIVLVCLADGWFAKLMCAVFFAASLLLFGGSALYHQFD